MLRRALAHLHPANQPRMSRQSYRHELVTAMTMPVVLSLVEGSTVGILARKCFNVSDLNFALIMAAPAMANLTSFFWAQAARGRPKVAAIVLQQLLLLACVAGIGLVPTDTAIGGTLLTALILVARCIISGIITLRSIVTRHNYSRRHRAKVTGRLVLLATVILTIAPPAFYSLFDWRPEAFRIAYPASTLVALIGVLSFSRVRLRRERELLRFERQPNVTPVPHGVPGPIYEYDPQQATPTFFSVLRNDVLFRRYMLFQFLLGGGAMMSEAVVIYSVADMTTVVKRPYLTSIAITSTIPSLLAIACMPFWARYLDRVHITRYRTIHSGWVLLSCLGAWWGIQRGSLFWVAIARVASGIFRGGGTLAWMLGHNDFADRRLVSLYMGIHVTLTGLRGAIFPLVGIALFKGWSARPLGLPIPAFEGVGNRVLLLAAAMAAVAGVGMGWVHHTMVQKPGKRADHDAT